MRLIKIINNSYLSKYILVGGFNTLLSWILFYLIYYVTAKQVIALVGSFLICVTTGFFLHAFITFKSRPGKQKYIAFVAFSGIIQYLLGLIADHIKLYPLITLIVASAISLVINFLCSKYLVFKINNKRFP